jgi:hypothetical protein
MMLSCRRRHGGAAERDGGENEGRWRSSSSSHPGVRGGWSSSLATVTGLWRANGVVWEVEGTVARRRVHGQSEGRREAMGHSGVPSRPGLPSCASWRAWASLGVVWARGCWAVWSPSRSRACRVSIRRVRGGQLTWWSGLDGRGEGMAW